MLAGDNEVVEEGEDEVEDEASPDRDVVEHCPVGSVEGDLEKMFTPLLSIYHIVYTCAVTTMTRIVATTELKSSWLGRTSPSWSVLLWYAPGPKVA